MCPVCLSTIALVVAGAVSTGGMTALAVKLFHTGGAGKSNSEEGKNQNQPRHRLRARVVTLGYL
jgi:hypothetical protein